MEPVRKLRIFVAMAARLLPGVRCSTLCTVYSSPSWRMVIPGRNCVARISFAPDAYGILRQAVHTGCVLISRRLDGTGVGRPRNRKYKRPGIEWSTHRAWRGYVLFRCKFKLPVRRVQFNHRTTSPGFRGPDGSDPRGACPLGVAWGLF